MIGALSKVFQVVQKGLIAQRAAGHLQKIASMSTSNKGRPLEEVVDILNTYANTSLAAAWDNVGLLIEPTRPKAVTHILLTNDLTEDVLEEAIDHGVDMIISYHPPIFTPLKSITNNTPRERIAATCLENRIALYSPHTAFDCIRGGVNDWLASSFDIKESSPIEPGEDPNNGMGRFCVLKEEITLERAVELVKKKTGLKLLRLARGRGPERPISKVGLCVGSGASVLRGLSADLYVTGEMMHHDILDAVHRGISVILTNHSDSERGFLHSVFSKDLSRLLGNDITVRISERDEDPIKTV